MEERLKAAFTHDEEALAAEIGQSKAKLADRIQQLFRDLPDPLLTASETHQLLGCPEPVADVSVALAALVKDGTLESSDNTLRPLDTERQTLFRVKASAVARLRLLAIESDLGSGTGRFQFTCEGRLIRSLARVDRLDAIAGTGNQRDEIKKHVGDIAKGVASGVVPPTSVLLVMLEERTAVVNPAATEDAPPASFIIVRPLSQEWTEVLVPHGSAGIPAQRFRYVELDFPFRRAAFDDEKACLLVDGQQRTAALSLVDIDERPSVPLAVNAVLADSNEAKAVFQVANTTQKIQAQFSRALLAGMKDPPGFLRQEQPRAQATHSLALKNQDSPFFRLVAFPGTKIAPKPPVAYNSLFQVISDFADSALPFDNDALKLERVITRAFTIVKSAWPTAWGKKPSESRLMHGVGLRSVSALIISKLEGLYNRYADLDSDDLWTDLEASVDRLKPHIVWTDEEAASAPKAVKKTWHFIADLQNTNNDIAALTTHLKKESLQQDALAAKKQGGAKPASTPPEGAAQPPAGKKKGAKSGS